MMPFVEPGNVDPPLAPGAVIMAWLGTIVKSSEEHAAGDALIQILGLTTPPRVLGCVETLPTPGVTGSGGRIDLVFAIDPADVGTAAIRRLRTDDIKWMEDCDATIYDISIRDALFPLP
jgi:hypothetical protein